MKEPVPEKTLPKLRFAAAGGLRSIGQSGLKARVPRALFGTYQLVKFLISLGL